uniref:Uncharacterized protein n=1 Tax=Onchocerca volvulus TaxID=6282 RepID=A0A8R1TPG0_ONCVO
MITIMTTLVMIVNNPKNAISSIVFDKTVAINLFKSFTEIDQSGSLMSFETMDFFSAAGPQKVKQTTSYNELLKPAKCCFIKKK